MSHLLVVADCKDNHRRDTQSFTVHAADGTQNTKAGEACRSRQTVASGGITTNIPAIPGLSSAEATPFCPSATASQGFARNVRQHWKLRRRAMGTEEVFAGRLAAMDNLVPKTSSVPFRSTVAPPKTSPRHRRTPPAYDRCDRGRAERSTSSARWPPRTADGRIETAQSCPPSPWAIKQWAVIVADLAAESNLERMGQRTGRKGKVRGHVGQRSEGAFQHQCPSAVAGGQSTATAPPSDSPISTTSRRRFLAGGQPVPGGPGVGQNARFVGLPSLRP